MLQSVISKNIIDVLLYFVPLFRLPFWTGFAHTPVSFTIGFYLTCCLRRVPYPSKRGNGKEPGGNFVYTLYIKHNGLFRDLG